jgi:hypothetical protein
MISKFSPRSGPPSAALLLALVLLPACRTGPANPSPARTTPAITVADVRSRIFIVADDSMLGRQSGMIGNFKMTEYLEREVARLGLEPGGENGSFFQVVPIVRRAVDTAATSLAIGARPLTLYSDFAPLRPNTTERYGLSLRRAEYQTVYGGRAGDSTGNLSPEEAAGKIVVLDAPLDTTGRPTGTWGTPGAISVSRYPTAAAIAIAALELVTPASAAGLKSRANGMADRPGPGPRPAAFIVSNQVAREIMGAPLTSIARGTRGRMVSASLAFDDQPTPYAARNVVAIARGSDPVLRNEYVALGAHSDHVGIAARAVEHDSLRSYYRVMRPQGAQRRGAQPGDPTPEQWARIRSLIDSLRKLRPARMDSISNGADDDASGSVALLEVAEALADAPRGRRSVLLVWHTAEEGGLLGSSWFTENPTVPRSSIVAQLNMDMVGRGGPGDIAGGGPRYLQVIGSRRISTALGDVIDSVNAKRAEPFSIDYSWDAPGHIMARYCRSDHWNYARRGIPIAFLSRGYHPDYHVVTDEPQYINYDGLARVARFAREVSVALANRNDRPAPDKPLPNPLLPCRH